MLLTNIPSTSPGSTWQIKRDLWVVATHLYSAVPSNHVVVLPFWPQSTGILDGNIQSSPRPSHSSKGLLTILGFAFRHSLYSLLQNSVISSSVVKPHINSLDCIAFRCYWGLQLLSSMVRTITQQTLVACHRKHCSPIWPTWFFWLSSGPWVFMSVTTLCTACSFIL